MYPETVALGEEPISSDDGFDDRRTEAFGVRQNGAMAKKKKRPDTDYQKPVVKSASKSKARADRDSTLSYEGDAESEGRQGGGVATKEKTGRRSKGAQTSTASSGGSGRSKAAKNTKGGKSAKAGLSGNQQWMLLAGLAVLIMLGGLIWSVLRQTGGSGVAEITGWDLPARSAETQNGDSDRIRHSDFVGTPTVLNFFESDCTELCERDILTMATANANYGDQADFIFVNSDQVSGDWQEMLERNGAFGELPVAHDIGGSNRNGLFLALGGSTTPGATGHGGGAFSPLPATAFYNADGSLESVTFAPVPNQTMINQLAALGVDVNSPRQ